jgi:hypothetical protein
MLEEYMRVTIGLARADFDWLLHVASPQSRVFTVLQRYAESESSVNREPSSMCVVIECDQEEAKALLDLATHHRPQAVRDIQYGLKAAQANETLK